MRFRLGGVPCTFLELLIVVLTVVCVIELIYHRRHPFSLLTPLQWAGVGLFLLAAIFGLLHAPDQRVALGLFKAYVIEPIAFGLICVLTLKTRRDWQWLGWSLLVGGSVIALIALVQYATGWGIPDPWQTIDHRRSTAVFGYPNAVGLYLAPLVVYAVGQLLSPLTLYWQRWLLGAMAVLMSFGILAARADGGVIAIAAGIFLLCQFTAWRRWSWVVAGVGLMGVLFFSPARDILLFNDVSGQVRLALWHGTVNLLQHHPLLGAGLGGFPQLYDLYRLPSHVELLLYPHNLWLDIWVEFGALGLVWLIVFVCTGALSFITYVQQPRSMDPVCIILLAVWLSVMVYGLVDVVYFKNDIAVLWWVWTAWTIKVFGSTRQDQKNALY
jgi:O-antigen ligase